MRIFVKPLLVLPLLLNAITFVNAQVPGTSLAMTPPMGWNSWNVWGCNIDAQKIRDAADRLVATGLAAKGYNYVVIDDCWQGERDAQGELQPNAKFGDMKALADYVHSKGLKIGIYSSPGPRTCQGYLGSQGYEQQDADTFARWGMDFLKYDKCSYKGDDYTAYKIMADAVKKTGRPMLLSACNYGKQKVWQWAAELGYAMWRTTGDIENSWEQMKSNGFSQSKLAEYAGPGHWNDPDMLIVGHLEGRNGRTRPTKLTQVEQYTHISLWALLASPLFIGADLTKLDQFTLDILSHDEVLAINQDPLGQQARRVYQIRRDDIQVWLRPLSDGTYAVGIFNLSDEDRTGPDSLEFNLKTLGFQGDITVRDVWKNQTLNAPKLRLQIPAHGSVLMRVTGTLQPK